MANFGNNLTEGSVLKKLIAFSIPFLISNIVQSFYNVADMIIVGNYSGAESMSGVNIGGQVTFILTNIVIGLCSGATVLIGQYIGARNNKALNKVTATVLTMLVVSAVFITVVMLIFKNKVLELIQTPPEAFAEADAYLTVTVTGIIFVFGYNALSAIMRGMGDSKNPLIFVTIACIVNVVLDLILVAGFNMGAFGAALATVVSQAISMILCILYMIKHNFQFDFKMSSFRIDKEQLGLIFKIGLPTCIQNGIVSISFLFITMIVNVIGGVSASAAVGAISKFNSFAIMPAIAMSASISTIAAQNFGANKLDRAVKTCKIGLVISICISFFVFALVQIFPTQILSLFGNDSGMISEGLLYMKYFSIDYLIVPFVFCINGLFIGGGHTVFSLINSMLSSILLRVPVSYLFGSVLGWGISGVGLGAPAASAGSLILIVIFLISGKWKINTVKSSYAPIIE